LIGSRKTAWIGAACLALVAVWMADGWNRPTSVTDFAAYWTAGRELSASRNPYNTDSIFALEQQLGFTGRKPLIMRNPPWVLPFVLPFGLLSYSMAQRIWLGICLAAILASCHLLWRLYGETKHPYWLAWALSAAFLPVATVLALGQIGPLILLGVVGFLDSEHQRRDGWAGAHAFLIALKPHLVFLFWPALLLWTAWYRRWRAVLGLAAGLCVASLIPIMFDRRIFADYFELWKRAGIAEELTPTPSGALRLLFGVEHRWLQFLPAVVALIWFLNHWRRVRGDWHWPEQMPWLLLVSLSATPYAWFFDQVTLLPCVLQVAAAVMAAPRRNWLGPAFIYLSTNGVTLALILAHRTTFWYAWTAPFWLVLYSLLYRGGIRWSRPDHRDDHGVKDVIRSAGWRYLPGNLPEK